MIKSRNWSAYLVLPAVIGIYLVGYLALYLCRQSEKGPRKSELIVDFLDGKIMINETEETSSLSSLD